MKCAGSRVVKCDADICNIYLDLSIRCIYIAYMQKDADLVLDILIYSDICSVYYAHICADHILKLNCKPQIFVSLKQ